MDEQHIGRRKTQGKREHENFFCPAHERQDREMQNSGKRAACFKLKSKVAKSQRLKSGYFIVISGTNPRLESGVRDFCVFGHVR